MQILKSQPVLASERARLTQEAAELTKILGRPPHLSVVLVGEDPASVVYVRQKGKMAQELGISHETLKLPANVSTEELRSEVERLNASPAVDGILIQRPVPVPGLSEEELLYWIRPSKDVDCFHPENVGRLVLGLPGLQPCTPAGVMKLLAHYRIPVAGKTACIVGRSAIVGKPMASLLLQANATLLHAHSRTPDLKSLTKQADLLVAAIGKPRFFNASHLKPGAIVIDVGISRDADGNLAGDVDFASASSVASAITPVPGGIGPMTILMLMENTLRAAHGSAPKSA